MKFENDSRAGRFESNIRMSELRNIKKEQRIYICQRCHRPFSEKSRYCPVCDTRTMAEVVRIKK